MIKKTLLSIALCGLFGFLSAQSLQFGYYDEEAAFHGYDNNLHVICDNAPTEWGEITMEKLGIKNLTANDINVVVEKEEVSLVEGTENSFCWGNCYTPMVFVSDPPLLVPAGTVSDPGELSFHHQIDPTFEGTGMIPGTSVVKYHAYPAGQPEDRATLEVWFAYHAENVVETPASFGKAYPNPAVNTVRFDVQGGHGTIKAVLYNLLGQEVKHQMADCAQGKIEFTVNDLQDGIYFCSFFVNNEKVKTEKFIVKR